MVYIKDLTCSFDEPRFHYLSLESPIENVRDILYTTLLFIAGLFKICEDSMTIVLYIYMLRKILYTKDG